MLVELVRHFRKNTDTPCHQSHQSLLFSFVFFFIFYSLWLLKYLGTYTIYNTNTMSSSSTSSSSSRGWRETPWCSCPSKYYFAYSAEHNTYELYNQVVRGAWNGIRYDIFVKKCQWPIHLRKNIWGTTLNRVNIGHKIYTIRVLSYSVTPPSPIVTASVATADRKTNFKKMLFD